MLAPDFHPISTAKVLPGPWAEIRAAGMTLERALRRGRAGEVAVFEGKLICPHCGHDGSPESAKSPLESFGFNYLEDDVVCREVRGIDADGRLLVEREPKAGNPQGTNPRIECRSCWQTSPLPMDKERVLAPESPVVPPPEEPGGEPEAVSEGAAAIGGEGIQRVADRLTDFLQAAVTEIRQLIAEDFERLEGTIARLDRDFPKLQSELAEFRTGMEGLANQLRDAGETAGELNTRLQGGDEDRRLIREELKALADGQASVRETLKSDANLFLAADERGTQLEQLIEEQRESVAKQAESAEADLLQLRDRIGTLERRQEEDSAKTAGMEAAWKELLEAQTALANRVQAQSEVIRSMHVAIEAQAARREELKATLLKLQALTQASDMPSPLPDEL